ncbi:MAG: RluA family pseudouridine synthase [Rhodocyclaceae bacterium]|nr:RluA family pseudouridine synthase [Rhodocyclaceae bacterium]MBX3669811.1 RluA family pseudouridine synthase [Rhodocyclaceae bacterium]
MKAEGKAPTVEHRVAGPEDAGQRLDNFLMRTLKGVPKSHIYRIVRSGEVRVNSRRAECTLRLAEGDQIRIPPVRTATPAATQPVPLRQLPVVYEDEHLLVIDKPAGTAVHGGSGVSFGVIELMRRARPQARFLELAHRLDRETSGLLLLAKKRAALVALHDMLREGKVEKRYLALVRGDFRDAERHVRLPLLKTLLADGQRHVSVDAAGRDAHSVVRRRAGWTVAGQSCTLVEVELLTGRTHQIRVHLAHLGHPLCGDEKYGDFGFNRELQKFGLKRMFLHAAQVALCHPASGAAQRWASPLPPELQNYLDRLGPPAA